MKTGRDRTDRTPAAAQEQASHLAIQALTFLAADADRMGRFLAVTGIDPGSLRAAAREPDFLAGVLDHLLTDEAMLVAFAEEQGLPPTAIGRARDNLGRRWERDIP